MAIAGPTVSLTLFALLSLLTYLVPQSSPAEVLVADLASINLVLALFNLIPGLPLDGGQILKAAVWKIKGDRFKGIHWADSHGTSVRMVGNYFEYDRVHKHERSRYTLDCPSRLVCLAECQRLRPNNQRSGNFVAANSRRRDDQRVSGHRCRHDAAAVCR